MEIDLLFRGVELKCRIDTSSIWVEFPNQQADTITFRYAQQPHTLKGEERICLTKKQEMA